MHRNKGHFSMAVILLTDETQLCFVASASLVKATYYISNHYRYALRFQNHIQTSYIIPTTLKIELVLLAEYGVTPKDEMQHNKLYPKVQTRYY
jgi:hypothetical protein